MVIIGISLLGMSVALIFVPLLSEIIASVVEKEGIEESPVLNDKASAVFNAAYASGCVSGPIIGGAIKDAFAGPNTSGFRETTDIMAICSGSMVFIYFFLNILPHFFMKPKAKKPIKISSLDETSARSLVIESTDDFNTSAPLKQKLMGSDVSSNEKSNMMTMGSSQIV